MIDQYDYVHLIALEFSKAFYTVRHSTLLQKTADLCIDDQLYKKLDSPFPLRSSAFGKPKWLLAVGGDLKLAS